MYDPWMAAHPDSPDRSRPLHTCTRPRPQRHPAPGPPHSGARWPSPARCFPETPRAAAASRRSAAALPPGFPCLVLAGREVFGRAHTVRPARVGRWWCVERVCASLRIATAMEGDEMARAGHHGKSHRVPAPRARASPSEPRSARLMSAASAPVGPASCTSATAHRAGFRRPREGFIRSLRGVHRSRHHTPRSRCPPY